MQQSRDPAKYGSNSFENATIRCEAKLTCRNTRANRRVAMDALSKVTVNTTASPTLEEGDTKLANDRNKRMHKGTRSSKMNDTRLDDTVRCEFTRAAERELTASADGEGAA